MTASQASPASSRWAAVVLSALAVLVPLAAAELASSSSKEAASLTSKDVDALTSSHQLLSGLGLARLPGQSLAQAMVPKKVHATEDDSRVFVVRLPPSQHYYSLLKSPPSVANSVSKQVEVGFRSNGKPARVYHWNIPVLKKMAAARRRSTQGSNAKPAKNPSKSKLGATRRKGATYHRVHLQHKEQQHQKLKQQLLEAEPEPAGPSPYYYAPAKKTSMHKLLGGNGKPHSMYVLEKSRAPAYYQRLLP